jgi:acyl-CoA thioester hydrolase
VRVYYQDTDAGGVVYHGTYLDYLERARTEWLRGLGFDIGQMAERDGVLFIVRELRVGYARPAVLDDLLGITVATENLGRAQFTLFQQVLRGDEMLTEASVNLACVAAGSFKPMRVPDALRERLASIQIEEAPHRKEPL